MELVASRDLRNHTNKVLDRVRDGRSVAITVHGEVVAELRPAPDRRPRFLTRAELRRLLADAQADPGLREDLARLAGTTTDELHPPS